MKIFPYKIAESGSFKRQIILTFVVGFLFLSTAFTSYQVKTESAYLYRDSTDETISLAESLAASSRSWVLAYDLNGMQEVVHSFQSHPELRYAMIISPSGKVLAHTDTTKIGQFVSDEPSLALIKSQPVNRVMVDDESVSDIAVPIMMEQRHIGWARLAQGREGIADNLRKMMLSSALFVLMALIFSLFAALFIANRLGYRIGYLMRVTEEVQAGNYATRANISGEDEIARLANRFNHMLDVLNRDEEQLRAASLYTRSLIEANLDPLVTISPEGKITDVNQATEKATGRARSELMGTDFSSYFTEPDKAREGYQQAFTKGFVTDYPLALRHREGHITEVLYNANVYHDEAGEVLGVFASARDITERKRTEEALRNSENRFRLLVENAPMCIHEIGMDGRISSMNRAGLVMMGVEQECKVQGFLYLDAVCDADRERIGELLARAYAGETSYFEFKASGPGGLIFKSCFVPIKNPGGSVEKLMGITEDITERKNAEFVLRQNEEALKEAQRMAHVGSWYMDLATNEVVWSEVLYQIYGFDPALPPPLYTESMKLFTPESWERLNTAIARAVETGIPYELELETVQKDGGRGWMLARGELVRDASGAPVRVRGVVMDITERKLAENILREKEERLALATINNGVGIWEWNLQTQEMIWDDSMFALYHIHRKDFIGTEEAWRASLHPDDLARGDQEVADAIAGKKPFETEFRVVWPNGEIRHIKAVAKVFRDDQGTPLRMLGINMDVTDRNKAEMELRESEDKFKYVFDHSPIGKTLTLPSGELQVNKAFCEMLGYSAQELSHSRWQDITHPDDIELTQREIDQLLSGEQDSAHFVKRYLHKSGSVVWIDMVTSLRRDEEGQPLYFMTSVIDITERKRAEEELRKYHEHLEELVQERTVKLETANKELETFSYSVSHDLRTPLRAIDGFSRILLDDYTDKLGDEGKRLLNVVRDNTSRMGQLIDDILKFSRTSRLEISLSEIDMEGLAHEVVEELQPADGKLQVEIESIPPATGDRAMIHQVFVNLLSNAVKFSRAKDIPIIKVGGHIEGDEAVYFVRDNGAGFDMHYVDKLFGVFQRLHSVEEFEGTGIGLAIVKRIVTRHGGRVWAEGKLNEGATIYFALPANQGDKS